MNVDNTSFFPRFGSKISTIDRPSKTAGLIKSGHESFGGDRGATSTGTHTRIMSPL